MIEQDFRQWYEENKGLQDKFKKIVDELCEDARLTAIEKSMEKTPPLNGESIHGKNTRKGGLKAHWDMDTTQVKHKNGSWSFTLQNNLHYASYLNDGHAMDRHYVPGLFVNPKSGLLEYDEDKKKDLGIMVGTKTKFVPGYYMLEAGENAWEDYVKEQIDERIKDL